MIDRRWQLIIRNPIPCSGSIVVTDALQTAANGTYCPDPDNIGTVWLKVGGIDLGGGFFQGIYDIGGGLYTISYASGQAYFNTEPYPGYDSDWTGWIQLDPDDIPTVRVGPKLFSEYVVIRDFGPLQYAKFSEEEDLSNGLIAKRPKLTTDIIFSGDDFHYFRAFERDATRRCEEFIIRRQERCNGKWDTVWTGTFSTGSGSWDLDACEFTVRPDPLDEYSCITKRQKQKFNILQVGSELNVTKLVPVVDFLICTGSFGLPAEDLCSEIGPDMGDPDIAPGWDLIDSTFDTIGGFSQQFWLYWRERITTECIDGAPVPPPGVDWVLYVDNCATEGSAQYVRRTVGAYPYGPATQGTYDGDGNPLPPDTDCAWLFLGIVYVDGHPEVSAPYFACMTTELESDIHLDRGRLLQNIVKFFLEKMECGTNELVSDFFEWDPPGDAPGYIAGNNYVTGLANQMANLLTYQKTDIIDYNSSNPATIGEMTFEELLKLFRTAWRVYWFIDAKGRFRLEHWTFFTEPLGLDISQITNSIEPLAYSPTGETPSVERATWMDAQGRDFVGLDIVYSGSCVNVDAEPTQWSAGRFSTDLIYIINPGNNLSTDGFVILACNKIDGTYYTIIDYGAITDNYVSNAPMSWANLQDAFWRSDRYRSSANMNGVETEFDAYLPNTQQKPVGVPMCCGYPKFDSTKRVKTHLGYKLGDINAYVKRAEFDEATEFLTLTLRYAY